MMITKNDIKHNFGTKCHNIVELFKNTNKLSTFMTKLEKQSLKDPDRYSINDYLGDGFEFLMEIFIKTHAYDNRIGITDYQPIQMNDHGVDGIGFNFLKEKCVIQHKYRANSNTLLTANEDHLSNMITDAIFTQGVKFDKENPPKVSVFYVFTTAKGLHYFTDNEMFKNHVKCFGYDDLRLMLQDNMPFWDLCREIANDFAPTKNNI